MIRGFVKTKNRRNTCLFARGIVIKTFYQKKRDDMEKLKGLQRKHLRAQAHHLKPVVIVGAKGLTESVIASVDAALDDHELIKVKFGEFKEEKKDLSAQISQATQSECVGLIGNIAVFYRRHSDPAKRKIKIF